MEERNRQLGLSLGDRDNIKSVEKGPACLSWHAGPFGMLLFPGNVKFCGVIRSMAATRRSAFTETAVARALNRKKTVDGEVFWQ